MTFEPSPNSPERKPINPLLKFVLELGPLGVFFFANARFGIFAATATFMVAVAVALAVSWFLARRLPVMPLVSGVVVLVFGSLTLALHDELFIKLKPTIVNTLFGVILLGALAFGKTLLPIVLDSVLELSEEGWRKLTVRWGVFFFFLAILNEIVWRNSSDAFWAGFKSFGVMPLTVIFALAQVPLIMKHEIKRDEGGEA